MKNQALFSLKDKSKKLKCRLLQFLFGALRVKSCPLLKWEVKIEEFFFSERIPSHFILLIRGTCCILAVADLTLLHSEQPKLCCSECNRVNTLRL